VHPMYSLTGIVQGATGVGPVSIMAFWKAIGTLVLSAGCLRVVTRSIPPERATRRALGLLLALFGGFTPVVALLPLLDRFTLGTDFARAAGDLVPAMALWDYAPLAIALGLMPFVIERLERLVAGQGDRSTALGAASLGLLVAWLHPWQGITLIAVAAGLVGWRAHEGRRAERRPAVQALTAALDGRVRALSLVVAATAGPVLYYLLLSHVDGGWATSELNSVSAAVIPGMVTLTCVVPLAAMGVLAARRIGPDPRLRGPLLWLLATLFTIVISPSGQYRALDGLAIPVVVLVVRAWPEWRGRRGRRLLATIAVGAALAPFVVFAAGAFGHLRSRDVVAYTELNPSDLRAAKLAAARAGSTPVLAPAALGTVIPALTGAVSWVGHPIWTPEYVERKTAAMELFEGVMTPAQARAFVRSTGAGAIVEPCGYAGQLAAELAPLGFHAERLGCSVVYARLVRGAMDGTAVSSSVSKLAELPSTLRG
jgi:hypothetical protein